MNKSESKYFNTALLMDEALIRLLEVKDYEYITVKEICEKAGVNRSTFYLHYETVNDLLSECLENIKKRFFDSFAKKPNDFIGSIGTVPLDDLVLIRSDYLRPYLTFFKENQTLFRAVYKNPSCMQTEAQYSGISDFVLRPIMKRFHIPETEQKYQIAFFVNGSMAIVREWINGGCKESVEEIETVMLHCIRPNNKSGELQ